MVPPKTASGTALWELSQETLPATALPLLITSVTSVQETAAWVIPSREVWRSHRLLIGLRIAVPLEISLAFPWTLVSHFLRDQ